MRVLRHSLIVVLMFAALSSAWCYPAQRLEAFSGWLDSHKELGRESVAFWRNLGEAAQLAYLSGIYHGIVTAEYMTDGDTPETATKRLYLLKGWKMSPNAYTQEVGILMGERNQKVKSIAVNFVRAESRFAQNAGQPDRAKALLVAAGRVENMCLQDRSETDVLGVRCDREKEWHSLVNTGSAQPFVQGFLDGIDVQRAVIESGTVYVPLTFRVGQVRDEINLVRHQYDSDARFALLFIHGLQACIEKSTVE